MGIDIDSARRIISVINRTFELMTMIKKLTNEEYDIIIRSFEILQKDLREESK